LLRPKRHKMRLKQSVKVRNATTTMSTAQLAPKAFIPGGIKFPSAKSFKSDLFLKRLIKVVKGDIHIRVKDVK